MWPPLLFVPVSFAVLNSILYRQGTMSFETAILMNLGWVIVMLVVITLRVQD